MAKFGVNFRQALARGSGTINDKLDDHVLGPLEASFAKDLQVSDGLLSKAPGWLKLAGVTPTGYALQTDGTAATGAAFPDHADYDLGKRWTIDVTYKATNLSAQNPIYWRADDSNDEITTLECKTDGTFLFTHQDSNGTTVTLTSVHAIEAGGQAHIRVSRKNEKLTMWVDRKKSASRTDLDADYDTAAADNKWYVLVKTATDGDTVTGVASAVGIVDELRVWRDSAEQITDLWAFTSWPWMGDERLVLYARFDNDSLKDYSVNGNDGSALASPTEDATSLVTDLAPILKMHHMETSDKAEKQWLVWAQGSLYAPEVQ